MTTYIVTYDLNEPGQKYDYISKKLKTYGTWLHLQGSVWIIVTNQSAAEVRDNLKTCLDNNDELFVAKLSGEAAWSGYTSDTSDWLKQNL